MSRTWSCAFLLNVHALSVILRQDGSTAPGGLSKHAATFHVRISRESVTLVRLWTVTRKLIPLFLLIVFGALSAITPARAQKTFTVTSLADDGSVGTLRVAINDANAKPGSTITFAVSGLSLPCVRLNSPPVPLGSMGCSVKRPFHTPCDSPSRSLISL